MTFWVVLTLLLPVSSHARVVILDEFEYTVDRNDASTVPRFQEQGWSGAKTLQTHPGAKGYVYTVSSIPGYSGAFPGRNSSRVLAIESAGGTLNGQTDFYLQLGNGDSAAFDDYIPGDVWVQFWMYPQYFGTQLSQFGARNKFFYVCNTPYPCHSHLWMIGQGPSAYNPFGGEPLGFPSQGEFVWNLTAAAGVSDIVYSPAPPENQSKLGQTNLTEWMRPNRWTLVKMRFNTTATTGNSWEMWLRPQGGAWTKVAEWIGGTTPNFTWNVPADSVGGHRIMKMPSTVGTPSTDWYDYWIYMDDFAMASTEAELPVYSTTPQPPPPPPPPSGSRCDVDTSGSTNVVDVQLCVNQAVGILGCTTGDIDLNGSCNVVDVQRVVNAALGGTCVATP